MMMNDAAVPRNFRAISVRCGNKFSQYNPLLQSKQRLS